MKVTEKDVLETAHLLNIDVNADEMEGLTQSFKSLIEYFDVLNKVQLDEEIVNTSDEICRYRDGEIEQTFETEALIEKSEEYEDNYVVIPNVL